MKAGAGFTMEYYFFHLNMNYQECMAYYKGLASTLVVTTTKGLTVQFPAMHIRPFVTSTGISGKFCMMTEKGKFIALKKLS